jgi:hypothetical protein
MPTKQLEDWTKIKICRHPCHSPPAMQVLKGGMYYHECPACGKKTFFTVPRYTLICGVLCALTILIFSCTDETNSRRALDNEGYTDIHFTGYQVMACSDDDTFHTGFTAVNSKGKVVSGTVCCGWIKNCTIRY